MLKRAALSTLIFSLLMVSVSSAHYLWVTVDRSGDGFGTTNIYYEGGPSAGDGRYFDHFIKTGKTWIRTRENPEPQLIELTDTKKANKRWMSAKLPAAAPRSVDSYFKFGVYRYGSTDVLLHYYSRNLDVTTSEDLHALAEAEHMNLNLLPHNDGKSFSVQVLWKGEPAGKRTVKIRGPKGYQENTTSDENGMVKLEAAEPGRYTFYANVEQKEDGTDDGKEYSIIRHHGTLLVRLPLKK